MPGEQLNFDFPDDDASAGGAEHRHKESDSDLFEWGQRDGEASSGVGFEKWREEQRERLHKFAVRLGLPLGKEVELTLHNGTVLRGELRLSSAGNRKIPSGASDRVLRNHLRLEIKRADFTAADVASCVRVD
jgi:hypothetical protein